MSLLPALLLTCLPTLPGGAAETPVRPDEALSLAEPEAQHGKVDWFEGTYEELLEKAREESRVIMLSFYSDTCRYCSELDREAFSNDEVVEALEPVLCFVVDADTPGGKAIDALYPTDGHYPTQVFLDSDGSLRDRIKGYHAVSVFRPELERILADEYTLGHLRRMVEKEPENIDHVWAYAWRLKKFGDAAAYEAQVERLRELDPKGTSQPSRHLALKDALRILDEREDDAPLREHLAEETYPELLYEGWTRLAHFHHKLSGRARLAEHEATYLAHRLAYHEAHINAWSHVDSTWRAKYGNHVAWAIYKDWAILDKGTRAKGIELARVAAGLEPGEPDILDTLAWLLFSAGEVEEAIALMRRCIALEPDREDWKESLATFLAEDA